MENYVGQSNTYPVFILLKNLVFPGEFKQITFDYSRYLKPDSIGILRQFSDFIYKDAEVLCAFWAQEGGKRTLASENNFPFYKHAILAEITGIREERKGFLTLDFRGLDKVKILDIQSQDNIAEMPFTFALRVISTVQFNSEMRVHYDLLFEFSQLLRVFLEEHASGISHEKEIALEALPDYIDIELKKTTRSEYIFQKEFLENVQTCIYHAADYHWQSLVGIKKTQALVSAGNVSQEIKAAIDILKDILDISMGEDKEEDVEIWYERTKQFMHPETQKAVERAIKYIKKGQNISTQDRDSLETFIERVRDLPWGIRTTDNNDLKEAKEILNSTHHGLDKVKDKIIEFLAVRILNPKAKGDILAFIGPPGVGKTSLGKAIAEALGRKFQRISLGGKSDEASIRGHRRTYIASLQGDIMKAIRDSGTENPVIMLDEIDKIASGSSTRGDIQGALMEVLDPEQNSAFEDQYFGFKYDLSQVVFICTGNKKDTIYPPLQDRMTYIHIPGYFAHQKFEIARRFLIPRQAKNTGVSGLIDVEITDEALKFIISGYALQAGLRKTEECIKSIMSKVATNYLLGSLTEKEIIKKEVIVDVGDLKKYIGDPVFELEEEKAMSVGEAMGLAVYGDTNVGGLLPIQCYVIPEKRAKPVLFTGRMGVVMRATGEVALTCVKRFLYEREIYKNYNGIFEKSVVHISAPEQAVPKSGPSAGIATFTAILSATIKQPIKSDLAMTGEIDLHFRVGKVGGIKEKILAAERHHLKEVIIPAKNERDLEDLPSGIKNKIKIHLVKTVYEVIDIVFEGRVRAS